MLKYSPFALRGEEEFSFFHFCNYAKEFVWNTRVAYNGALPKGEGMEYVFQKVESEGIYELPVGPVHVGIIEPGHFRFSLLGEEVVSLEARLGYKHKGVEKLFEVLPMQKKIHLAERVSGDSSFHHSLAFCQAVEAITGPTVPERARLLRTLFAECERLANHFNDIGFIMMDTAYTFGGVTQDLDRSVLEKFRASMKELREDFPYAAYSQLHTLVVTGTSGDVYARFMVRVQEVSASFDILDRVCELLISGPDLHEIVALLSQLPQNAYALGITEGWRGDIVYFVATDSEGNISRVQVRDPSFLNWPGMVYAVVGNVVPDFPLINKSFNLSYSGNDL